MQWHRPIGETEDQRRTNNSFYKTVCWETPTREREREGEMFRLHQTESNGGAGELGGGWKAKKLGTFLKGKEVNGDR